MDLRPAALERIWQGAHAKWKHTIEPDIVYNYVTGVNDFTRFIRIDQDDTISDTNEVQYSITQRLFRRRGGDASATEEFASWTLLQKYYFDPTFGGALVPGERNVLAGARFGDAVCVCRRSAAAFAAGERSENHAGRQV